MANSLVQFRIDDTTRIQATNICEQLGIDLPTAMRMFVTRLVQEKGIPFSMKLTDIPNGSKALAAMKNASRTAEEKGISNMTLDEINAEISAARTEQGGI
jgi:DNA-damage-inducible protein J